MPIGGATYLAKGRPAGFEDFLVIDTDVHNNPPASALTAYMSQRWRDYASLVGWGRGASSASPVRLTARPNANRLDSVPPGGGMGGSDPDFARFQLLDEYGMDAAIISHIKGTTGRHPLDLQIERTRALNDYNAAEWLASDPRWFASINTLHTAPDWSAGEVHRVAGSSDRYVQVLMDTHLERPAGDPMYWPIYQAAVDRDLPVAIHVHGVSSLRSGVGEWTFYFEARTSLSSYAQGLVSSMIFNGVFDRFPTLKIVLIELQWSWAVPLAWRMDAAYETMREEVGHLQRKPSEYFRDHFWFTTQPAFDPEYPEQFDEVYGLFSKEGFGDRLMFSSDYPHWDMDSPFESLPRGLDPLVKRRILETNAHALYQLELPGRAAA
ncbi:amidohydrolase [Microbacterium sp. zg.B48]|uniref:amidohydrolase family protein n=1 Tax=Microbacterium sp. zg.B48 TaxID=2969408 RepID=UPI00214BEA66|nr:amidohydrolase family protein [Microbacterium sp. zg.B48]MCR2764341.1 amidohydrolase [Microbacterium sp. zg.B48]